MFPSRKLSVIVLSLFAILAISIVPLAAQTTNFTPLNRIIEEQMAAQNIPGLAIAITQGNDVIYSQGFGVNSVETQDAVTPSTVFRIASTTKSLTAFAVLQLAASGQISLDDPVITHIPEFTPGDAITIRHLLSHTSGLGDYVVFDGHRDSSALVEYVSGFSPAGAFAAPGLTFSYSNPNFNMLALVIERVTDVPYAIYMQENVFSVLGMTQSTLYPHVAMTYPYAVGHQINQQGELHVVRPEFDSVEEYASGLIFSTVTDLAQYAILLNQDGLFNDAQLLDASLVQEMKTPVTTFNDGQYGYGLGLEITERRGLTIIGHDGTGPGHKSEFYTIPALNLGVILLANQPGFDGLQILDAVLEAVGGSELKPETPVDYIISDEMLNEYAGQYLATDIMGQPVFGLDVQIQDGELVGVIPNGPTFALQAAGVDTFTLQIPSAPRQAYFVRDEAGTVNYMVLSFRAAVRQ